jgi:two-component system, OmpR family, alkaline phosphatase synthesis response regulator PhoP
MRVLVAEDNVATASVISFNLKSAGFEVIQAASGETAWSLLQQQPFDLLVTDFQLPGVNGGELCQRIRNDPRLAAFPVILLTAKGLEIDTAHYRESLQVSAVLIKPFSPRRLTQLVQETIAVATPSRLTG